jgi:hypothetical protein
MNMPGFDAESSLGTTMGIYRGRPFAADFLQKAAEELCRNLVSSRIRIWARTGDAERMGGAISYAVFLAGFLPSQSVVSCSDRSLSERGRS